MKNMIVTYCAVNQLPLGDNYLSLRVFNETFQWEDSLRPRTPIISRERKIHHLERIKSIQPLKSADIKIWRRTRLCNI